MYLASDYQWLPKTLEEVENMKLSFTIPGAPVAKARGRMVPLMRCRKCGAKTARRMCRCGSTELELMTVLNSPAANTVKYESLVRLCASTAMAEQGVSIMAGLLRLEIVAYFQIAETRLCKRPHREPEEVLTPEQRASWNCKKLHDGDPHGQRPDADNIAKSICDGCNQVVWPDDSAVAVMQIEKRWSVQPRCEVVVCSM